MRLSGRIAGAVPPQIPRKFSDREGSAAPCSLRNFFTSAPLDALAYDDHARLASRRFVCTPRALSLRNYGGTTLAVPAAMLASAPTVGPIERFMAAGFSSAVLLPARTSTVQDVVSVLESFKATAFGNAKLMTTAAN